MNNRVPSASRLHLAGITTGTAALVLAGCATVGTTPAPSIAAAQPVPAVAQAGATAPARPTAAAAPAPSASAPARTPTPPPFAEVTRDAKRADGYLSVWTRDDKTWLEIPADMLDKPFFFGSSLASGLGERFFYPGLMGREHVVVLHRVGNNVQLLARNQHARAPAGTPLARAVAESYSDSLLGSAPLAAAPHAQSKALLVDAQALLGGDISGVQTHLEASYRLSYSLDRGNSSISRINTQAEGTHITLRQHYAVPRLPAPPAVVPGAPPPNPAALPNPSTVLPDPRSLFLSIAYTLAPLPEQPMKPRQADQRVGYFTSSFVDFGNDNQEGQRTHFIERWRLEKKDPDAEVSEPKQPIRVVMDRNIPEKWREPVRAGILEWNKAFERAGFRNAIALEQQAADASWSSVEGTRMLAVRWFALEGPGATAVGPSQSDPRTGEILRGASIIPENWVRIFRARAAEVTPRLSEIGQASADAHLGEFAKRYAQCSYADDALQQAQFGFDVLSARGVIDPNGPDGERFIAGALKDVTMHEIGHALGLRHNFRASVAVTPAQLRDPAYTAANGVSASVMDYNAQNVPLDGEPLADYHMGTLGAYDYHAVEYGYREFPAAAEKQELTRIAARSDSNPALAFATDDDLANNDPLISQRDLGNDPLAFAQRQIKLARELWQRTQKRELGPDDDMTVLRRNLQRGFGSLTASLPLITKYVGGVYTSRAKAGAGQAVTLPVPAAQQRAALDVVVRELFSSASFKFDPKFMGRLAIDTFERGRGSSADFSLPSTVLALQRLVLDTLMAESLATRLADAESKVDDPRSLLNYAEVQDKLSQAVWSELDAAKSAKGGKGVDIDSLRRNLQREHVRRLAGGVLRASSTLAADVRSVHRQAALQLQKRLIAALASPQGNALVRAHLDDSLATLTEALKAPLSKQGV